MTCSGAGKTRPWPQLFLVLLAGAIAFTNFGTATSRADGLSRKLYWTDAATDRIQRSDLDGSNVENVLTGLSDPAGLAIDSERGLIYWIEASSRSIRSANLNGTNQRALFSWSLTEFSLPSALSLDDESGHLYWSSLSASGRGIHRVGVDGTAITTIIPGASAYGLTLDLSTQTMYWTDTVRSQIFRANLDGSNQVSVVSDERFASSSFGIDVDEDSERIYWGATTYIEVGATHGGIQHARIDGSEVESIVTESSTYPYVVYDAAESRVYWSDSQRRRIERVNSDGTDRQTLRTFGVEQPYGLAIAAFATSPTIASSDFSEPTLGSNAYVPGPNGRELGFQTTSTSTSGANPFAGTDMLGANTPSTSLSHRSVDATTTFDLVDLTHWRDVTVSVSAQVSGTNYEVGDFLEISVANGTESVPLINLIGGTGGSLNDLAATGFVRFRANVPDNWTQGSLQIRSSSNSSTGAERYDFDEIVFAGTPRNVFIELDPPNIVPTSADVVLDLTVGQKSRDGLSQAGSHTLGYLQHPGEEGGDLQVWFALSGIDAAGLETLLDELVTLGDVASAHIVNGSPLLPNANLHVVFTGGAETGKSGVVRYDFGSGVVVQGVAVPEPNTLYMVLCGMCVLAAAPIRSCRRNVTAD